jgi:lysophospholipase L1-like esterase
MPRYTLPLVLAVACCASSAAAASRVILVGDSTMASTTGYGDALCARFAAEVECINLARGGRSSGSFRAEGRWAEVQSLLKDDPRTTYVLIQFGHNDQPGKPGRSTDFANEFPANMARYVHEARAAGGIPVLLTPLTRRSFEGPYVHNDLAPWSAAVRKVARDTSAPLLDLNLLSLAEVEAMGEVASRTLARSGANYDQTHVGPAGAAVFSGIVARELQRLLPPLSASIRMRQ